MVRKKVSLTIILLFVFLLLFSPILTEVSIANSDSKQRIYDFANLLSPEEVEKLENLSQKYSTRRKTDIIILTTNDTKGKKIEEYMGDFYYEKALGYNKPHGNTAILTIDMKNRQVYLAGYYLAEEYLDNSRLDLIREKITPDLTKGNYYKAFKYFIKTSYKYMGIKPKVNPDNILFSLRFQIIASLTLAGIIVGTMAYNVGGKITVSDSTYRDFSTSKVLGRRDNYIRTSVTRRRKPSSNSKSGGSSLGGGGGGGVSRGGHSHSGSKGSF